MLIGRCAWHRQYHGYPFLSGIASWRGLSVRFTDGICPRCMAQFRSEHQRYLERHDTPAAGRSQQQPSHGTAA
jgi:hypothetical protein